MLGASPLLSLGGLHFYHQTHIAVFCLISQPSLLLGRTMAEGVYHLPFKPHTVPDKCLNELNGLGGEN